MKRARGKCGPESPSAGRAEAAEALAIAALTFIAEEPERLGRFLALTGIGPESLRAAAREPGFLARRARSSRPATRRLLIAFAADRGHRSGRGRTRPRPARRRKSAAP